MLFLADIFLIHNCFAPWRKSEKMTIIHNIEGYGIRILPPVGYVPIYPNSISRKKTNHVRLILNLGSTVIILSSSVLLMDYWQSNAFMGHLLPNSIFSGDFGWFLMRKYKHSENCKVGGHHCLTKSTTGKKA